MADPPEALLALKNSGGEGLLQLNGDFTGSDTVMAKCSTLANQFGEVDQSDKSGWKLLPTREIMENLAETWRRGTSRDGKSRVLRHEGGVPCLQNFNRIPRDRPKSS